MYKAIREIKKVTLCRMDGERVLDIGEPLANPFRLCYDDMVEIDCELTPRNPNIDYLSHVRGICENIKKVYLLNCDKDRLYKRAEFTRDLLRFTEQHKEIYETHSTVTEGFVEQAGTYENVIKSYDYYKAKYDSEYTNPAAEIDKEINNCSEVIKKDLDIAGLRIEPVFTFSIQNYKPQYKIIG